MSEQKNFFRAAAEDFQKIPGSPVAYWVSEAMYNLFKNNSVPLESLAQSRQGIATADNNRFLRFWSEVSYNNIKFGAESLSVAKASGKKWFPHNKGGAFRKWYGNCDYLINWQNDGKEIKSFPNAVIRNPQLYFHPCFSWSKVSSAAAAFRYKENGYIFDSAGMSCFPKNNADLNPLLGLFNSKVVYELLKVIAPTLNFECGDVANVPVSVDTVKKHLSEDNTRQCIEVERDDWNAYETAWDFVVNPLVAMRQKPVNPVENNGTDGARILSALYATLREKWATDCEKMRRLETENNRIFIDAYGLQDELTPEVPWDEITLTCNPWYRYNAKCGMRNEELGGALPKDAELEKRLMADTVKELISYAVGCMMGRYSLDKPGLILADQGATITDYYEKVGSGQLSVGSSERSGQWSVISDQKGDTTLSTDHCPLSTDHCPLPTVHFSPDEDGIIPVLDNDWFADDIVTRFKEFIKVAFGEEHFFENMTWIEDALGKDIRSYFTKDFYKDHLQRYQNRPIYWLFQSPKGAFRALVYMHRYKPDMVGGVLGYLRSLQTKVENQLNVAMQIGMDESKNASERVRANKDAVKYAKAKKELDEYERNVLYPLSTERIEIDLDEGVKVNYRKFGTALRKVAALEAKGE